MSLARTFYVGVLVFLLSSCGPSPPDIASLPKGFGDDKPRTGEIAAYSMEGPLAARIAGIAVVEEWVFVATVNGIVKASSPEFHWMDASQGLPGQGIAGIRTNGKTLIAVTRDGIYHRGPQDGSWQLACGAPKKAKRDHVALVGGDLFVVESQHLNRCNLDKSPSEWQQEELPFANVESILHYGNSLVARTETKLYKRLGQSASHVQGNGFRDIEAPLGAQGTVPWNVIPTPDDVGESFDLDSTGSFLLLFGGNVEDTKNYYMQEGDSSWTSFADGLWLLVDRPPIAELAVGGRRRFSVCWSSCPDGTWDLVYFAHSEELVAATDRKIWISGRGPNVGNWHEATAGLPVTPARIERLRVAPNGVVVAISRGELYVLDGPGSSWRELWRPDVDSAYDIAFSGPELLVAEHKEGGRIIRGNPSSKGFVRAYSGLPTSPVRSRSAIDVIGGQRFIEIGGSLFLVDADGSILESKDLGRTWSEIKTNKGLACPFTDIHRIRDTLFAVSKGSVVDCGFAQGELYRSADRGLNWEPVRPVLRGKVTALAVAGESLFVAVEGPELLRLDSPSGVVDRELLNKRGLTERVSALWVDTRSPEVIIAGTKGGLFWSVGGGDFKQWEPSIGRAAFRSVNSIEYSSQHLMIGTDAGVFYVVDSIPRGNWAKRITAQILTFYRNYNKPWFWAFVMPAHILGIYAAGLSALLFMAWGRGSAVFSRSWLISTSARPLVAAPGVGRWALFLGYNPRLLRLRAIRAVALDYFGLPSDASDGGMSLPDRNGEALHAKIAQLLAPQQPLVLLGKGGSGKSSVLARLAYLAVQNNLPNGLRGFVPVLVPAAYYSGGLVQSIFETLRQRDGVGISGTEGTSVQMQTGKFLILFDGVSEVAPDAMSALNEILQTAQNADFRSCRFVIATRPLGGLPPGVAWVRLRPLTRETISVLLPRYGLGTDNEKNTLRQLSFFGDKPVDPLLFSMAVTQRGSSQASGNRAGLYESYFRHLLRVDQNDELWIGWRTALERFAEWFLMTSGRRGIGLPHRVLLDLMAARSADGKDTFIAELNRYYGLRLSDELHLLRQLQAAGIIQSDQGIRWRFVHDTFEEFFAASRLVSCTQEGTSWPSLASWEGVERRGDLAEVMRFVAEIADGNAKKAILHLDLPQEWKASLTDSSGSQ